MISILSYVEQGSIYDMMEIEGSINSGLGIKAPINRDAIKTPIATFCCPSDDVFGKTTTNAYLFSGIPLALSSYPGVIGPHSIWDGGYSIWKGELSCFDYWDYNDRGRRCWGSFWRYNVVEPVTLRSFTDGLSNTIIVGETYVFEQSQDLAHYTWGVQQRLLEEYLLPAELDSAGRRVAEQLARSYGISEQTPRRRPLCLGRRARQLLQRHDRYEDVPGAEHAESGGGCELRVGPTGGTRASGDGRGESPARRPCFRSHPAGGTYSNPRSLSQFSHWVCQVLTPVAVSVK